MPYTVEDVNRMLKQNNLINPSSYQKHLEDVKQGTAVVPKSSLRTMEQAAYPTLESTIPKQPVIRPTIMTNDMQKIVNGQFSKDMSLAQEPEESSAPQYEFDLPSLPVTKERTDLSDFRLPELKQTKEYTDLSSVPLLKLQASGTSGENGFKGYEFLTSDEIKGYLEKFSSPDYKMTKADKEIAKAITDRVSWDFDLNPLGATYPDGSPIDYSDYQKANQVAMKNSKIMSAALGAASSFPAFEWLMKWINDYTNGKSVLGSGTEALENAEAQNPYTTMAGKFGGTTSLYSAGGQLLNAIPGASTAAQAAGSALSKVPVLGNLGTERLGNLVTDTGVDLMLDTIPTLAGDIQSGKSGAETAKDVAGNVGQNVAFNLGADIVTKDIIPAVGKYIKNMGSKVPAVDVMENSIPELKEYAETAPDALKQVNNAEDYAKQLGPLNSLETPAVVKEVKKVTDPVEKAFMDPDVYKTHTPEQISDMMAYLDSTDDRILEFADKVRKSTKGEKIEPIRLNISERASADMTALTGIDTTGNKLIMDKGTIEHIDNRHGVKGKADKSMSDDATLSRIQYILDNYDDIELGKGTKKIRTKDGKKAPTVIFEKKINGTYYIVEAVTDASSKTNNVVSVYTSTKKVVGEPPTTLSATNLAKNTDIPSSPTSKTEADLVTKTAYPMANADLMSPSPYVRTGPEFTADFKVPVLGENVNSTTRNFLDDFVQESSIIPVLESPVKNADALKSLDSKINVIGLENSMDETAQSLVRDAKMDLQMFASGQGSENAVRHSIEKLNDYLTSTGKNYDLNEELYGLMGNIQKSTGNAVNMNVDLSAPTKTSKTATNTFRNTDIFKSIEGATDTIEAGIKDGEFKYNLITERESLEAAAAALEKNAAAEEYRLKTTTWTNGSRDTDEAMMILEQKFKDAAVSGDNTEALMFAKTMSAQIRNQAQGLQAMAKYSRTSTGTLMKAQTMIDEGIDDWMKNNPKQANQVRDFAEDLMNELENLTNIARNPLIPLEPGTVSVDDIVDAVSRKVREAGLEKQIDQSSIEKIADMLSKGTDVNKIEETVDTIMALGWPGLDEDTVQQVVDIFEDAAQYGADSMQRVNAESKAYALLADKIITPTWQDKWDAWRYFSMLANPTTHERNMIGNTAMNAVSQIKDAIGTGMESAVDSISKATGGAGIQRTKAVLNPLSETDRVLKKAAGEDAVNEVYRQLSGSSKYNVTRGIESQGKAFKGKVSQYIQKLADMNSDLLEKEDWIGLKAKYSQALAGYLKANGADASIFKNTDKASQSLLNKARAYAISQSQEVTFHEDSVFASALSQFSENLNNSGKVSGKVASALIEGIMPFKKTPANILKEGARYSPLGIARGLQKTAVALKTGKYTASEAIESMSKGLTGTGIMALGAYLGSKGILRGTGTGDENQDAFDEMQGAQDYAIVFGDKSYTIDWMAPSVLPLMVGVQLQQEFSDGLDASDLISSISGIADPIIETSFMSGLQSALDAVQYAESGEKLQTFAGNVLAGYAAQGVPTAAGKVTRAFDNTRRSNLTENTGLLGQLEYQYNRARAKLPAVGEEIPVLSDQHPEYVDAWGRTQQNFQGSENTLANLAYQMLSPGYYSQMNTTDADRALQSLYDATGEASVLPKKLTRSAFGERMSAEDYTEAQKQYGGMAYEMISGLTQAADYIDMAPADQAEAVSSVYSLAKAVTNQSMTGKEMSSVNQELYGIYQQSGADGLAAYLAQKSSIDNAGLKMSEKTANIYQDKGEEGLDLYAEIKEAATVQKENNSYIDNSLLMAYLQRTGMSDSDKGYYISQIQGNLAKNAKTFAAQGDYESVYKYYTIKNNADYDGNGSLKKDEIVSYLDSTGMSTEEKRTWFGLLSTANNPY